MMKTRIVIAFQGESATRLTGNRVRLYDGGIVPLPDVGEIVSNPTAGLEEDSISGVVISRRFSYEEDEVVVMLLLDGSI